MDGEQKHVGYKKNREWDRNVWVYGMAPVPFPEC